MATVEPKFSGVHIAQPAGQMFTVDIAQSAFLDDNTTGGGRCSPCGAHDFATKPTTLNESLKQFNKTHQKVELNIRTMLP